MTTFLSSAVNIAIFGSVPSLTSRSALMIRFTYTLPTILVQLNYTAATAQLMTIPM